MVSISSTTAALCPQSFASMTPCTQCTHHTNRTTSIPFPADMAYLHASSSRILTPARAEQYFPDDVEAAGAAAFWNGAREEDYNGGYLRRCSDAEWGGFAEGEEGDDDDSRSDLGAPEMDEQSWDAPPPAYEDVSKGSSSSSRRSRGSCSSLSPEAGTLQLSVNTSILTLPPSPTSSSTTTNTSTTEITPTKPSLLSLTFLGTTRAHARARRQAERKAAQLEELHDAWARLGLNTREMLARGGVGALPPYFNHPPRCELGEMVAQLP
ncbi:unnamed protein product [Tilletia caries]|uniref:Uncharacterized protein n=2 Tax=Tilletia caries TaxID=13290 RepID=A0ABN7IVC6_9BASI|nr:hypothetical protein CF336_g1210 [Tilletia laevis]KAE8205325.1 hypothetical protein CF335_g2335 [Tilletia laevis]CAD6889593.1 unnamed protein product [Tilletia caries]CAD6930683.1 unnamed protein product [Tilletia caries]CAD7067490.1 unnamed protein product [Tilletia caries]